MLKRICQLSITQHLPLIVSNSTTFKSKHSFKGLKKYIDFSKVPKLKEEELDIQYIRGWGPGGQATNKTNNAVQMKHLPTGIVVKCHETRSQSKNKEIAKEMLINRLDLLINGEDAVANQEKKLLQKKTLEKQRRQKKKAELRAAFKEREGIETTD